MTQLAKVIAVGFATIVSASAAAAQTLDALDPPRRMVRKAPVYKTPAFTPAPAFSWTGFYAGGNVGYSSGRANSDYAVSIAGLTSVPLGSDSAPVRGIIGGGQLGYNFQTGALVYGVEADWQFSGAAGSGNLLCPPALCSAAAAVTGINFDHKEKLTSFGTVRGRIGYAFGRSMVYGTGGLAYGTIKSDVIATTALGSATFSNSVTRTGWALGAGYEQALFGNWSWKLEYLYLDFGTFTVENALGLPVVLAATTITQTTKFTDNVFRFGLNYRF